MAAALATPARSEESFFTKAVDLQVTRVSAQRTQPQHFTTSQSVFYRGVFFTIIRRMHIVTAKTASKLLLRNNIKVLECNWFFTIHREFDLPVLLQPDSDL